MWNYCNTAKPDGWLVEMATAQLLSHPWCWQREGYLMNSYWHRRGGPDQSDGASLYLLFQFVDMQGKGGRNATLNPKPQTHDGKGQDL